MRLTHQLTLFIVTLFILVLAGTIYISIKSSQEYLTKQLQTQLQDTTKTLGLKLAPALLNKDYVLVRVATQAAFDSGYYQQISIKNMLGEPIADQNRPVIVKDVPQWFINMFKIEAPVGEAVIQDGWKQLATLLLVAHTGHAYHELWQVTISNISWLLFLSIIAFFVLWGIIQLVMRPLNAVVKQSGEIARQNFSFRPKLPKTPELRMLVMAMNNMAEKVELFLSEQTQRINRLRTKVYNDKTTGLLNRSGLEIRLNDLLQNKSENVHGELLLVRVEGLEKVNQDSGYEQGNAYLSQLVDQIKSICDGTWELARLNGKDFIILMLGHHLNELEASCERVQQAVAEKIAVLQFYVAGIHFQSGQKWPEILSMADMTLSQALESKSKWHALTSTQEKALPHLTATQWREKLLSDLTENAIALRSQACFGASEQELHQEILLWSEYQGEMLPTATVLSIAYRCNLTEKLDYYVLQKVMEFMAKNNTVYAVNITPSTLMEKSFLNWLDTTLQEKRINKDRLIMEIKEQSLHHYGERLMHALHDMSSRNISFAIDGVAANEIVFSNLGDLIPRYIKIDGRYSFEISHNPDHQGIIENILVLAHTLSVPVIAVHVETQETQEKLFNLGVDGVQGYYSAKPTDLI